MKTRQINEAPGRTVGTASLAAVHVSREFLSDLRIFQSLYYRQTHEHISLREIVEDATVKGLKALSSEACEQWKKIVSKG